MDDRDSREFWLVFLVMSVWRLCSAWAGLYTPLVYVLLVRLQPVRSFLGGGNQIRQTCIFSCLDGWPQSRLHKYKATSHVLCSSTIVIRAALASLHREM